MAQITIGGTEYQLPEMNFLAIERAWPYVVEATEALDPMKGVSCALSVFASLMMEADDFDKIKFNVAEDVLTDYGIHQAVTRFLKKNLKGTEMGIVKDTMFQILKEGGLEITEGEMMQSLADQLAGVTPSPETAPPTLPSSLPQDAKEEVGID